MIGISVLIGFAMISHGELSSLSLLIAGFMAGFFTSSFSMAINDIVDLPTDLINKRRRPLVTGTLSVTAAKRAAIVFLALAVLSSSISGLLSLLYVSVYAALGYAYSTRLKKRGIIGNVAVAASVAAPFPYGALLSGQGPDAFVALATGSAFCSALGREVLKGIPDVEGDRRAGNNTIAVRYGSNAASILSGLLLFFASGLALSPLPLGLVRAPYLYAVLPPCLLHIALGIRLLRGAEREQALRAKSVLLLFMGLGLLAFVIGGVTR
jgi:geranylgeranylglycerol-phosphate geranylgeranyltransferase